MEVLLEVNAIWNKASERLFKVQLTVAHYQGFLVATERFCLIPLFFRYFEKLFLFLYLWNLISWYFDGRFAHSTSAGRDGETSCFPLDCIRVKLIASTISLSIRSQ